MEELKRILESYVGGGKDTEDKLLGVAFVLVDSSGILFEGSAGRQGFASESGAYRTETVTWIASLTKLVTATSVLQLVESGIVTLDEYVRSYVPRLADLEILRGFDEDGIPILDENLKPITLRHLLTHSSGLPYDLPDPSIMRWASAVGRTANNLQWSLDGFTTPLVFPPGEGWVYGTSLDWAGQVVEKLTGQRLGDYFEQQIFHPLGLTSTTFYPTKEPCHWDRISEYAYRSPETNGRLEPSPLSPTPAEHEVESGGSGLFSTATDYAKILMATLKGDVLLKRETTEMLLTPQLGDVQRKAMMQAVADFQSGFAPEFPPGLALDFSFGGIVNLEDVPLKRRKGSVMWSGFANGHWWLDKETGIAGVLLTTVICDPVGDPVVIRLYHDLEAASYRIHGKSAAQLQGPV